MKASEAPEKIWISPSEDLQKLSGHIDKDSVEYIRKDAFIEKACEWLKENIYQRVYKQGDSLGFPTAEFLEGFKKAMKL